MVHSACNSDIQSVQAVGDMFDAGSLQCFQSNLAQARIYQSWSHEHGYA